ncbi:DHH family phosphoesterase [Peijinzhouia sedimentorum]
MQKLQGLTEFLQNPRKVVITTHHKPDADALGSSLGLAGYLKKKNHQVTVITPTDYPNFLNWMSGNDEVIIFEEGNQEVSAKLIEEAELIVCLDFPVLKRINEMGDLVRNAGGKKLHIDHHPEPEDFADYVLHDTSAASTAELIFDLIHHFGDPELIDAAIGEAIYAGIMTDTGSFKHPNTTKKVHLITAELIDMGVDVSKVSKLIYDNNSVERLQFLGYALSQKLIVLPELRTAYFVISQEDLKKFSSKTGDTEGIVNYALSINGIVFAAVIIDRAVAVKMSFRSVGDFSVNDFARTYFEGGGHKNAAGGQSTTSLEETVSKFRNALAEVKEQLINN